MKSDKVLRELMLFVILYLNYDKGQGGKGDNVVCYLVFN